MSRHALPHGGSLFPAGDHLCPIGCAKLNRHVESFGVAQQ